MKPIHFQKWLARSDMLTPFQYQRALDGLTVLKALGGAWGKSVCNMDLLTCKVMEAENAR